jgi:hypothetical protein
VADTGTSGPSSYCRFIPGYTLGACITGVIQYGDNGTGDSPEIIINAQHEGQFTWQPTRQVLFASGPVSVEFRVSAGGSNQLTLAKGSGVGSASDGTVGTEFITGVEVGAAVFAAPRRRMHWSNLVAKYYKNNVLREAVIMGPECEPKADTYPPNNRAFQAASYPPSAPDNDAVTVTGILQLAGDRGDPNFEFNPSDFYAKILVFATNCHTR